SLNAIFLFRILTTMQIAETLNEGLKRAFMLTITAGDIDALVEAEVTKVAPTMKMPGFRPGKVPANLVRKMHGPALQQEALNTAIQNGVSKLVADNKFRPAMQPSVALADGYEPGKDAAITVELEILPDVPAPVIDGIRLERLTVEVDEALVDEQMDQLLGQQKSFDDAPEGHAAATGDLVVMDFIGKVDGVAFDGGTGEGMSVEIGTGRLIPGFEDQLVGVKKGDEKQINVTFPEDYNVENLKGKAATFDLVITDVRVAKEAVADEDFAKSLGLESLEQLRGLLKGQIEQEHNGLTRTHMKRKLLDTLAGSHDFEVPPSMVEAEFQQIWSQLEHEAGHEADKDAALAEMEGDREEYRRIAERRVRLGLLLSEIGQANGVDITQAEMNRLVAQAAQQYPQAQRERFMQYVQQEPMAAAQLRAPLYEDKVVDLLFAKAEITDRVVARAELEAEIEAEDGATGHVHGPDCGHDHGHDEKPKAKKAAAPKKAKAVAESEVAAEAAPEAVAEKAPAKKPAAKKAKAEVVAEAPAAEEAAVAEAKPKAPKKPAAKKA
ncbi:MAG: trigger factor, partial [Sphingomonadales bacterium]|nr:trigger factor [Sphingomonadales bacterium]